MRARFAYISSLGTTAILVAAALLMLAVVSAIVAYRGWPGDSGHTGSVQAVPLAPGGAPKRVALVRRTTVARGVERSGPAKRVTSPGRVATAGLVKAPATGRRTVPGLVMVPVASSPMAAQPSSPGRPTQAPPPQPAAQAPERTVPDQPAAPTGPAVPGTGGGLPIVTLPDPSSPPPPPPPPSAPLSTDEVSTMVGTLLTGNGPPPPGIIAELTSRALGLR
jgi:hypothetical protein